MKLSAIAGVLFATAVSLTQVAHAQVINLIPDIHKSVAKHTQLDNQMTALGNRLIAHYKSAQDWDGINPDNPEAVALREKISREEKEYFAKSDEYKSLPRNIVTRCKKECSKDELAGFLRAMIDFDSMAEEWEVQHDRYHALGY
jgi:hypothetical protein